MSIPLASLELFVKGLNQMEIVPGIGLGSIKFGISEYELINHIGKPDIIEEEEYIADSGDWHRTLRYIARNLYFIFNKEDNFRLGDITIMCSGFTLFKKDLFGVPIDIVKKVMSKKINEIPKYKDYSWDRTQPHELLEYDGLSMNLWFDSGNLSEIQFSYLFESDGNTIIWPKKEP